MKYWLKTFNNLNIYKEIFSDKESLVKKLKEIILSSETRHRDIQTQEALESYKSKYIDQKEYQEKLAFWENWTGFTSTELYGKITKEDKEVALPSIKIISFADSLGYEDKLFLSS